MMIDLNLAKRDKLLKEKRMKKKEDKKRKRNAISQVFLSPPFKFDPNLVIFMSRVHYGYRPWGWIPDDAL